MTQSAAVRPEPTFQRKAAIAHGGALDHAGSVTVAPIPDFDLNRTIFQTLEGRVPRAIMKRRVGKEVRWHDEAARRVQSAYEASTLAAPPLPEVRPELLSFLVERCDFDVEHADGSFLDHLYFCYEYGARHFPEREPLVLLLHSILGTGTNTFAMPKSEIPALQGLLTPFEWTHTEAFPSVLRLLYAGDLRAELRANAGRADALRAIRLHRVIDDATIEMSGEDLWIALNFQLVHLVDFLPVANWAVHGSDTSYILFRDLYDLLERCGRREARIAWEPPTGARRAVGESFDLTGWLAARVPPSVSERMAARSVRRFSERIGHSLRYELDWA